MTGQPAPLSTLTEDGALISRQSLVEARQRDTVASGRAGSERQWLQVEKQCVLELATNGGHVAAV
jgi:hypothetical protein